MSTWRRDQPAPVPPPFGLSGWLWIVVKGLALVLVLGLGLALLLALRLPERLICGRQRRWTPYLPQAVCRVALRLIGIGVEILGTPSLSARVMVANHTSWLDIFALNAAQRVVFVAKSEVRGWAGIGWLARATGTLFIRRDRREARRQQAQLAERLNGGQPVLLFPEGTSSDGLRVLPFKTTLFDAFAGQPGLELQAASVSWHAPAGADPCFYGWWGDMDFAAHLLAVLAAPRQGSVRLLYHPPVRAEDFADRKTLARFLERQTRAGQILAEERDR